VYLLSTASKQNTSIFPVSEGKERFSRFNRKQARRVVDTDPVGSKIICLLGSGFAITVRISMLDLNPELISDPQHWGLV
jgi:hypothetical protein